MYPKSFITVLFVLGSRTVMSQEVIPLSATQSLRAHSYEILNHYMESRGSIYTHGKCGLPVISYAIKNRDRLNPEVRFALDNILTRPTTQKSILSGHFRVHYDTTGSDAPAMLDSLYQPIPGSADQYADSVASIANYCETFETQVLGYLPSPSDGDAGGGPEYDIYIASPLVLGPGGYGQTNPDSILVSKPDGGTYTSFIEIDNTFDWVNPPVNRGMPALRVTLAHELHHSIQIGNYGYWTGPPDLSHNTYIFFYELTSTWIEDVVFPDVKDYLQYTSGSDGHFAEPWVSFNSDGNIMYSRAIWAHFIAKRFGRNAMLRSWEEISSAPPLQAIDRALSKPPYNSNFKNAFAEWTVWNYFTGARSDSLLYYPEGSSYPEIASSTIDFVPPAETLGGNLYVLSSAYENINSGGESLPFLVSNVNLDSAITRYPNTFPYSYILSENQNSSIAASLGVPDQANWYSKALLPGAVTLDPFPDPFRANGSNQISIPVSGSSSRTGTLYVYSSDMKLVYSGTVNTQFSTLLGGEVFQWNGVKNNDELASSGIYIYFIQLQGQSIRGKFALIRK
ncbi:MAG: MXAN_6640 family putative metalloprotease [Bacteroidota bacterium]